jgi:hypothetical protein
MSGEPSHWFVRDDNDVTGPLTEAEMRRIVTESSSPSLFVRQGASDWHPAAVIRSKMAALAANGIYVMSNAASEGPYTFTKAYEVLQLARYDGAEVRTGLNGPWFPARLWLAKVEELKREHEAKAQSELPTGGMPDVASLAGDFLKQLNKPGSHLLASQPSTSPPLKRKQPFSKAIKILSGGLLAVGVFGFGVWAAISAYQCRHIAARYQIESRYESTSSNPSVTSTGPIVAVPGQLFRPTFSTTLGRVNAGTAFAARVPGRDGTLIVSALQLFGPIGGLSSNIPSNQLAQQWTGLAVQDSLSAEPAIDVPMRPITFSKAASFPSTSVHGDIVVCTVTNPSQFSKDAIPLSSVPPQLGDRVWLFAQVTGHDTVLHPATIASIEEGWLVYKFDEARLNLQASNGAPVINQAGHVIAINAAGGEEQGTTFGIGTAVTQFLDYLISEL